MKILQTARSLYFHKKSGADDWITPMDEKLVKKKQYKWVDIFVR